jgi:hypothetical protein
MNENVTKCSPSETDFVQQWYRRFGLNVFPRIDLPLVRLLAGFGVRNGTLSISSVSDDAESLTGYEKKYII